MFRVDCPSIIRSTNNCLYSSRYQSAVVATGRYRGGVETVPDTVDTVICAPDDGWRNHPKHVEQFTDKIYRIYFGVLLTVHLTTILGTDQLNAQILVL
jgi:hypothetical protein